MSEFAEIWRAADKVVYTRTLTEVSSERTRLEREFNPSDVQRQLADTAADVAIGGPELAAHALRAGLVDECQVLVAPVTVGGGKPCFPGDLRVDLDLVDERRFGNGMTFLRYRTVR